MSQVWVTKELSQLGVIKTGNTPKTSEKGNFGDFIPFIKPANFNKDGSIDYEQGGLSELGFKNSRLIAKNSVLMVCIGATIGKTGFTNIDITCNQQINSFTPNDNLYPRFFYYAMVNQDFQRNVILKSGQATLPIINKSKWSQLEVSYPQNIEAQKQIVAKLDQAFGEIEKAKANAEQNLKNARELFDNYLQGIFSTSAEGWCSTELGELCEKMEYGTSSKSLAEGDTPVLRMGNIQNGKLDWNNLKYSNDADEIEKYSLKVGDVLFNRTNSAEHVGKAAIYDGKKPSIFAGYLIRIHRKKDLLDSRFLNYYLNSVFARNYGKTVMSQSVNQANINGTKLKQYPISIPSLNEQKILSNKIRTLDLEIIKLKDVYINKLDVLEELKQSILQKAFNGELT